MLMVVICATFVEIYPLVPARYFGERSRGPFRKDPRNPVMIRRVMGTVTLQRSTVQNVITAHTAFLQGRYSREMTALKNLARGFILDFMLSSPK